MIRLFFLTFTLFLPSLLSSQSFWKITSERGEQLLLTIEVNEKKNEFEAFTRKDALKDIAGPINYLLALTAGKIQYPEIIFIDGKTSRNADSLILTGTFYYIEKKFPFRASIYGNHISGRFIDYKNKLNRIEGVKVSSGKPINDYQFVINTAFSITNEYIFNSEWLKTDEWLNFREKTDELKPIISDDYEIGAAWFWLAKSLPFQPYELNRENPYRKPSGNARRMSVREPMPKTALIDAGMLPATSKEMDSLALLIERKGCTNLIIDLRGKSKIQPESVEFLTCYLAAKPFIGGVYPTRKFFETNRSLPKAQDYQKYFKNFADARYNQNEFYRDPGRYFNINPVKQPFRGKVYLLTDSRTSGVSSSLIYILKKHKIATIAGQRASISSGLSERLMINSDFSLTMVVSEFFTPDNKKLTEADLEPDILIRDEDALQSVLKILHK
jgi:hypothetical protein